MFTRAMLTLFVFVGAAGAHPVPRGDHDRTAAVRISPGTVRVEYRVEVDPWTLVYGDVAESDIDTKGFRKPSDWYNAFATHAADRFADGLRASVDDKPLSFRCESKRFEVLDHVRFDFVFVADIPGSPGRHAFTFEDRNYLRQAGKQTLTLAADAGITLSNVVAPDAALLARASIDRGGDDGIKLRTMSATYETGTATDAEEVSTPPEAKPGHSLVALLDSPHGFGVMLLVAAFFGALHALTPGHGKTLVAAYLIGERGTVGHALLLGLVTTLTHTGSVLLVALGLRYAFPDAVPADVQTLLEFVGGLLVAGLGVWLLLRRLMGQADHVHLPGFGHHHHHHESPKPRGVGGLIVLGISGGIVPCWDAIALLGIAIASHQMWLALPLLLAFSVGLAGVLVAIGVAVVKARNRVAARWSEGRLVRALPLVSAVLVTAIGLWLCRDSLK
jgi:ABC-type nickel/cobalt efflux system permease component RcnA